MRRSPRHRLALAPTAAGFAGADAIGPSMRTLIAAHRAPLGPIVAGAGEKR